MVDGRSARCVRHVWDFRVCLTPLSLAAKLKQIKHLVRCADACFGLRSRCRSTRLFLKSILLRFTPVAPQPSTLGLLAVPAGAFVSCVCFLTGIGRANLLTKHVLYVLSLLSFSLFLFFSFSQARATPGKMLSPEDCTSLIEAFTEDQILNHVKSLDTGMHVSQERIQVRFIFFLKGVKGLIFRVFMRRAGGADERKLEKSGQCWSWWLVVTIVEVVVVAVAVEVVVVWFWRSFRYCVCCLMSILYRGGHLGRTLLRTLNTATSDRGEAIQETVLDEVKGNVVFAFFGVEVLPTCRPLPPPPYSLSRCVVSGQAAAGAVLTKLRDSQFGWVFNDPVDPVHLNLPDYFEASRCLFLSCPLVVFSLSESFIFSLLSA